MADMSRSVLIGGFVLTFISGIVNAVGFLSFAHQGLTHLTGITTHISIYFSKEQFSEGLRLLTLIISFVLGSILSGAIIQKSTLKFGRNYGVVLLIEAVLLLLAVPFLNSQTIQGEWFVACACGLQNAMATTYSGSILRTTHLTGIFTDLGLWLGHRFRKLPVDPFAIKICLVLICGFFTGGIIGAFLFGAFEYYALVVPAILLGVSGIFWIGVNYSHHE